MLMDWLLPVTSKSAQVVQKQMHWSKLLNGPPLYYVALVLPFLSMAQINNHSFHAFSQKHFHSLASTYVLSRLTVIHHAALNCCRRLFAIIITSFIFGVSISPLGMLGILVSFSGFMSFTHYKWKRMSQPRPLSSLLPMSAV